MTRSVMTEANEQRVRRVFVDVLGLDGEVDWAGLHYQSTPGWDSLVHLGLVAALEAEFAIELDDRDILDLDGYPAALEVLRRHGVAV